MIRGIHHVAINTGNFTAMQDFYARAFGFEVVGEEFGWRDSSFVDSVVGVQGSSARTVMLRAANVYLELFEYFTPKGGKGPQRPYDRGYTHFCVDTDDIEADFQRLLDAGMSFPRSVPDEAGGIRAIYGKDPDGNVIELQQLAASHVFTLEKLPLLCR